jgi:hypothetical protein
MLPVFCKRHCAPSVDELLAPFRKQVEESRITDEELDQFGEEVRQEKQALKAKTA